jgi:hypothetical protein
MPTPLHRSKSPVGSILLATLIAGTLDASAAMINFKINAPDVNSLRVWRFVAGGAFGEEARSGSLFPWALYGILFHFLIAFLFTLFFYLIYPRFRVMHKNLIVTGILYGAFVWIVMNLIVVPLSNVREQGKLWTIVKTNGGSHPVFQPPTNIKQFIINILFILFCVGLPIALIIGNYFKKQVRATTT